MTKQVINVGTAANDKKGDSLRAAFVKVNSNFTELYTALGINADGNLNIGAFEFTGSVMSTTDSTAIVIDQATTVTSNLSVGGDILPQTALGGDLGSSTLPWRSLYVSSSTIYIGGTSLSVDSQGNLLVGGQSVADVGTAAWASITGKPTFATVATTGAYADLTGKPTIPTSFSSLVNGAHQFVLNINGAGPWISFPESSGSQIQIQGTDIIGIGFEVQLVSSEDGVRLSANATATNGPRRDWQFGTDGILTLPQNGSIKSDTDINITIDTPDSSTFNWQFGADGDLTLPAGGTILNSSGQPYVNGVSSINTSVSTSIFTDASGDYQYGTLSYDYAVNGVSNSFSIEYSRPLVGGNVDINVGNAVVTGDLTLSGDIKSNGNINIDINLSDSTLRRWQFGEDGDLVVPVGGSIKSANNNTAQIYFDNGNLKALVDDNYQYDFLVSGDSGMIGELWLGSYEGTTSRQSGGMSVTATNGAGTFRTTMIDLYSSIGSFPGNTLRITTSSSADGSHNWIFDEDGDLTLPGDIRSEGNINIEINLADSTLRRWQFGEDGNLTFPDGTNYSGSTITLPQTTNGIPNKVSWNFSDIAVGSTTTSLEWNLLSTTFSDFLIGTSSAATPFYFNFDGSGQTLGTIDNGGIFGGGKLTFGSTAGNNAGDANAIELKATNGDVYLTSTESVKITVDANDSSARVWTFDPSGNLNVPGGIVAEYEEDFTITTSYLALGSPPGPSTKTFTFAANGELTVPRIINADQDLVISGGDYYGTRIEAGLDGIIYIGYGEPHDIYIGTNTGGKRIVLSNDRLQILATVPASSKGSSGDYAGMVAFNGDYIFYCVNAYDGTTDIWRRVALTGGVW